jgi:hypothetical protein
MLHDVVKIWSKLNNKITELANVSRSFDEKEWFLDQYFVIFNVVECLALGPYSLKPLSRIEYSEVEARWKLACSSVHARVFEWFNNFHDYGIT